MKIVFCFYENINFGPRAQEELKVLSSIGDVEFVSYAIPDNTAYNNVRFHTTKHSKDYYEFIHLSRSIISQTNPQLVFLHDNYCSPLINYIKRKHKKTKIIYDMSELYIGGRNAGHNWLATLKANYLKRSEYRCLYKCDGVLAANIERAHIAKGFFALEQLPYVFSNLRELKAEIDNKTVQKIDQIFYNPKAFYILYAGGLADVSTRDTYKLLKDVSELGNNYQLIIAGKEGKDEKIRQEFLDNPAITNIRYIGMLTQPELRYIYRKANVNIVTFGSDSINNIYCASGKFNEGIFEGIPAVVSENPPLVSVINQYAVGEVAVNHDYAEAIRRVETNYEYYRENVKKYADFLRRQDRLYDLRLYIERYT